MKTKDLKKIAKQIAEAEKIIQNSTDSDEISEAKALVLYYTSKIDDMEDFDILDDYISEFLKN